MIKEVARVVWVVMSIAWIGAMVRYALWYWPRLPLDSGVDEATQQALQSAVNQHIAWYAAAAIIPPVIIGLAGRYWFRKQGRDEFR